MGAIFFGMSLLGECDMDVTPSSSGHGKPDRRESG
jgi:hypothetical protein